LGAESRGVLSQQDTYFNAVNGRLKLREMEGKAQLIAYERPDDVGHRTSSYRIVEVENAGGLRNALADALGIQAVVAKKRLLFIWENVRIHLDDVEGLGNFIEFEAVAPPESDLSAETERVRFLREKIEIAGTDLIDVSYCDLIRAEPQQR
jgi:adenylate cyclase, class 2